MKDIEDIKGDIDRITLPKQIGIKASAKTAAVVIIIAIILSPFPVLPEISSLFKIFSYDGLGLSYLVLIIPADLIFIISIRHYAKNPKLAQNLLKLGMLVGLIAYAVGSIIQ